jgi:sRNA-binding carbon storage regulator CsrA
MALVLSRRVGEEIQLSIDPNISPEQMRELIREGITLRVGSIESNQVKISLRASQGVHIVRTELLADRL